jgi:hypothetical protein
MAVELTSKRIELAKEMIKDLSRVALRRCGQPRCTCGAWTTRTWRHSGIACKVGDYSAVKNLHGASHDQAPQ